MENVLCMVITIRNAGGILWQNVPTVERMLNPPRKLGRWLANLTKPENALN
jgi:hypothetical protein